MKKAYKLFAVWAAVLLLLVMCGCDGQTAPGGKSDPEVPTLVIGSEDAQGQDAQGSFIAGEFDGESSKGAKLGGSRTDKIEKLEEADIRRETVPEESIEWIPGAW